MLSLIFYATWNLYLVFIPFVLCTITFLCARVISANKGQPPARRALKAGIEIVFANVGASHIDHERSWNQQTADAMQKVFLSLYPNV